jgi:NADPH2:quinone reductase
MRAVLCNAFDGIKALTIGETEEPRLQANEVLIDVHAASVSYMDYLMARGGYQMRPPLPYVPGTDGRELSWRSANRSTASDPAIGSPARGGPVRSRSG